MRGRGRDLARARIGHARHRDRCGRDHRDHTSHDGPRGGGTGRVHAGVLCLEGPRAPGRHRCDPRCGRSPAARWCLEVLGDARTRNERDAFHVRGPATARTPHAGTGARAVRERSGGPTRRRHPTRVPRDGPRRTSTPRCARRGSANARPIRRRATRSDTCTLAFRNRRDEGRSAKRPLRRSGLP